MASDVVVEKLVDSESYKFWKFQTTVIFKAQGTFEIVNGDLKFEQVTDEKEKTSWKQKDAKAQKVIVTSVDKQYLIHILNCSTSYEMYSKICGLFERDKDTEKCNLLQEFFNYKYDNASDISNFLSNIQNMAYKLKMFDQNIDDEMLVSKILSSLPEQYKHFATAWDSTPKSERTLANLSSRLIAEEARNKHVESEHAPVAFKGVSTKCTKCHKGYHNPAKCTFNRPKPNKLSQDSNNDRKCFVCNKTGHLANVCPLKQNRFNNAPQKYCQICKKTNHEEKDCYFRKNDRSNKSDRNKITFISVPEKVNIKEIKPFVVDSGCTSHMSNDISLFSDVTKHKSNILVAKNQQSMKAESKGNIVGKDFDLNEALYVPDLCANLLSVNAVTENDGKVIFTKDKVIICKDNNTVCEGLKQPNGLYTINVLPDDSNMETCSMLAGDKDKLNLFEWHCRLGHPNLNYMKRMLKLVNGMNVEYTTVCEKLIEKCEICIKAKQTRLPFSEERKRANRPLQIIHTDICGPIEPPTWDGKKYLMTILDDYTHFIVVKLLSTKGEAFECLKEYILEAEAEKNLKVSKIRCDNGGEYVSHQLKSWCKNRGIGLDYTIPHTPQHNGKAERLNRTIIEKVRTLLFDNDVEKVFWGEAARTAAYILNRSPTEAVKTTPAEEWTNTKPDVSRIRKFGCIAYVKTLGYVKKLEPRSCKMMFVGYAQNGYRIWNPIKRKIIIARDVKFIENYGNPTSVSDMCKEKSNPHVSLDDINPEPCAEMNASNDVQNELGLQNIANETNLQDTGNSIGLQDSQLDTQNEIGLHEFQSEVDQNRPLRNRKKPVRFQDFVMLTYNDAISGPDKDNWKQAIEEEKKSLIVNNTWQEVDQSEVKDKKILNNMWVFSIKNDGRYKARLVVKGFQQEKGIDYDETFSPVVSSASLRLIFALTAKNNFHMTQFDIKTAFLYGNLEEEIYMRVPEGFELENKVLKLQKALYGLKQAPFKWNQHFTDFLKERGLIQTLSDQCIFKTKDCSMILAMFVDDGIVVGSDKQKIKELLFEMANVYKIRIEERPNTFLGMEIKRSDEGISLKQKNYTQQVLEQFGMNKSKSTDTPIAPSKVITEDNESEGKFPYRQAIGNLLYLSNKTRPDITLAVNLESRHVEKPTTQDVVNVKRTLRYLCGTQDNGLLFSSKSDDESDRVLETFCDADYAGDVDNRRSTTGYVILYGTSPISWCTRRQPIVALSSTEAEYISAAECVKELLFLKTLLQELTNEDVEANLHMDNQSAMTLMRNGVFNRRSKHIDVRYHFLSENIKKGKIKLSYVPSSENLADVFTKPLGNVKFAYFKKNLVTV